MYKHLSDMRTLYLLGVIIVLFSCRQQGSQVDAPIIESNESYSQILDSIISSKNILFSTQRIEAWEPFHEDKSGYPLIDLPRVLYIDTLKFRLSLFNYINEEVNKDILSTMDTDRYAPMLFSVDTAAFFSFKGKQYAWVHAYRNNGGIAEKDMNYHLIADLKNNKANIFYTYRTPPYPYYFGDIDGDNNLDFLLPSYDTTSYINPPKSNTTELLTMTLYSINKNGVFEQNATGEKYKYQIHTHNN